ncbi:MAG: glycoside hydrolase family 2 TIM barrel-domain containing protein [Bacteroidales bacterium]|nr:glycoside hydrolase family 2 TIM barrel-domain containing protein [Bacteroidales bacterium]MDT8374114.1 glycoside hydrolase family 2 protein [Bacteroidales bacterium]
MKRILTASLLLIVSLVVSAQVTPLTAGWRAKKASEVNVDGCHLTKSDPDLSGWISATVPGTVLTTLVNNGRMPEPWFGINNEEIPDVYNEGRDYYTYWFFTRFSAETLDSTKQVWINFRGINYRAEIYFNGKRISDDTHEGMFLRQKYNVTSLLDRKDYNRLAVRVEPPLHPGNPNGGQGGDGMIGRDVTMQFTAGWDWIQPVRDRNTGIWDEVSIEVTGDVDIRNGFARTRVPGARLPGELQDPTFVTFSAEFENVTDRLVEGEAALAYMGSIEKKKIKIEPGTTATVVFSEMKQTDPRIWWPNGMGQPSLYPAVITFHDKEGATLDREDMMFGFRETGSWFDEKTGSRVFTINGQKIFIRGANWIVSDGMLRLSRTRYDAEVKMHAEMNMNMIRVWGGSIMERPEFYEACDKYGILVWQDLWITGDCNGRWPDTLRKAETQARRREYPDNHSLFINSVADQVKMLRNHPSLYMYCGGNEFPPPPELDARIRKTLDALDGTRLYFDESTSSDILRNTIGGTGDGPYNIREPLWFFTEKWHPFNPEMGSVGLPNMESLEKMMNESDLIVPSGREVNEVWRYHKYMGYGDMIDRMGEVSDLKDFVKKAQLVNYEQYRSMVEGYTSHMWDWYTGFLLWKSQNPWPALKGQMYDWYLDQNAGFYGFRHGAAPVHLQFNPADSAVYVVNATPRERKGMRLDALLTDENGREIWKASQETTLPPNSHIKVWDVDLGGKPAKVYFLRLRITYVSTGLTVDENTYWLPREGDQKELMALGKAKVVGQMMKSNQGKFTIDIANSGDVAAFFVRMKVIRAIDGKMVTPVFFDDNYIVLLPGEKKSITVDVNLLESDDRNTPLMLHLEGVNLPEQMIRL